MTDKQPRFRSPPFPYIGLEKAMEKVEQLYAAVRGHSAALPSAAKAWQTGVKSSATLQSIGALIQYGLLDDDGAGEQRKVKLTPLALRIVMDKRPDSAERAAGLREAALQPPTFKELYSEFGTAEGIDESLLVHALTAERVQKGRAPYSEQSAEDVIRIYRGTIRFAGVGDSDMANEEVEVTALSEVEQPQNATPVTVGRFVQWVSGGVVQFTDPQRVRAISDDGEWAFLDNSETGIAVSELEVIEPPAQKPKSAPPRLALPEDDPIVHERASPIDKDRMKVVWEGSLIHISATVDKAGLARLRLKLDAMETLLDD